jgi:hypothetical protein
MMAYFMPIWSILLPLEIFYGQLVYFVVIWYISPCFGMLYQEKSGNPADELSRHGFVRRRGAAKWSSRPHQKQKIVGSNHARGLGFYKLQCRCDNLTRVVSF